MKSELTAFLFRGLLATHAVRDMQGTGLLRYPVSGASAIGDVDLFAPVSEAVRSSSLHMQRCYRLLFILENVVREFVGEVLEDKDGADWFDTRANSQTKKKVNDRKEKEEKNSWHIGRNTHPINYIDFGDLSLLIQSHYDLFKDLLPNQIWAVSRLNDAERSRNVIAHTNILAEEEVSRLEILVRDWIRQVL